MEDLISVIVPIYKVEKYLNKCIESIVNQSYTNLEIILVDDGSPDKCEKICDDWALKDKRIKVIHQENCGLSVARNVGIDISTGKYISFVDSDDYVHKDFIKALLVQMTNYNSDISSVGRKMVTDDDCNVTTYNHSGAVEEFNDRISAIKGLVRRHGFGNCAWNKLYKRELFDGIRFPAGRKLEDLGTMYLLLDRCEKVTYNPDVYYLYYQRSDSIMHQPDTNFYIDYFELSIERYNFIRKKYGCIYEFEKATF